jgi:hypothetical protein
VACTCSARRPSGGGTESSGHVACKCSARHPSGGGTESSGHVACKCSARRPSGGGTESSGHVACNRISAPDSLLRGHQRHSAPITSSDCASLLRGRASCPVRRPCPARYGRDAQYGVQHDAKSGAQHGAKRRARLGAQEVRRTPVACTRLASLVVNLADGGRGGRGGGKGDCGGQGSQGSKGCGGCWRQATSLEPQPQRSGEGLGIDHTVTENRAPYRRVYPFVRIRISICIERKIQRL